MITLQISQVIKHKGSPEKGHSPKDPMAPKVNVFPG